MSKKSFAVNDKSFRDRNDCEPGAEDGGGGGRARKAQAARQGTAVAVGLSHGERARWRMGLAAQPHEAVHSSAYRLATVIEDFMHRETGEAFPAQDELAARSGLSGRQVREHLAALAKAGWVAILSGKERTRPRSKRGLHYRPMWPDEATRARCMGQKYAPDAVDDSALKTGSAAPVLNGDETGSRPPVLEGAETGTPASQNRKYSVAKPEAGRRFHSTDLTDLGASASAEAPEGNDIGNSTVDGGTRLSASPIPADDRDCPSTADLELAALGALEAPRAAFGGATIPPPVDDPCRGWVPEYAPAGSEDYADANALAATASARPMLDEAEEFEFDDEGRERRIGGNDRDRRYEPDDVDATEIDEDGRERPIRDSGDGDGAADGWLSDWPDDEAENESAKTEEV
ncbi:hypothetical protein GGR16_002083 [Chelatococcus caeni]|uniref:Helix-turn-helix domain-containing protein n=1 Tax=Chelatococcus caeni TaxID=1348468 RepID=A0A840BVP8_9HYPH|nr:helix-turn-helix domain-containing protein [Chelatococcus caeni]MBB4017054.1 hypothetical protein [Chelatococcus caeni]